MLLTGTVHPPGGASAVLAATDPVITAMGWYFVGLVLWGATLMVVVGLVVNNIQRQFPVYWWTPMDLRRAKKGDEETVPDGRGGLQKKESEEKKYDQEDGRIEITGEEVFLPENLSLNADEAQVLERLRARLRERADAKDERENKDRNSSSGRSSTEFTMVPSRSDRSGSTQDDR
jgi:CBS-domain-containing membrane protein